MARRGPTGVNVSVTPRRIIIGDRLLYRRIEDATVWLVARTSIEGNTALAWWIREI